MAKKKPAKKRSAKQTPLMPIKPKRKKQGDTPASLERRARFRRILARTHAARVELDELADGADTSDLDQLPVLVETGPKRKIGSWRAGVLFERQRAGAEPEGDDDEPKRIQRNDYTVLPKASGRKCKQCRRDEHVGMTCEDLRTWLLTAAKVLAGELESPDTYPTQIAPEDVHYVKKSRGRPRKKFASPEEEADYYLRRKRAA